MNDTAKPAPTSVDAPDWSTIPAPIDDGATRHLLNARMASIALPATDGHSVDLAALTGRSVVYAYPRTGRPGMDNPPGWDLIPGARLHAAKLFLPRSLHRAQGAGRRAYLRPLDAGSGLSARSRRALATAFRNPVGRNSRADSRDESSDFHHRRHDAVEALHLGDRQRHRKARFLSRVSAGPQRERRDRVAVAKTLGAPAGNPSIKSAALPTLVRAES